MKLHSLLLIGLLLMVFSLFWSAGCGDDDDDQTADDDATDDDAVDDDTADDDTVDDDSVDDDSADDDSFGFVVGAQFIGDGFNLIRVDEPLGEVTTLLEGPNHIIVYPAVSPDGAQIAFASNLHDPNPGFNFATMLYLMPAGGDTPQRVTDEDWHIVTETYPVFSPDGARLAYMRSSSLDPPQNVGRIWLIDVDGANREALYDDTEIRNDYDPAFSPDGHTLVFVSDGDCLCGDLYLADLTADPVTRVRLTESDAGSVTGNSNPFFDATGQWVYFESSRDDSYGLCRVAVAGGDLELVWDIGFSDDGPNLDMYAYSGFRPTPDYLGLAGIGAADGTDELFVWPTLDPLADPIAVTGADIDAVDPFWWRPAAE